MIEYYLVEEMNMDYCYEKKKMRLMKENKRREFNLGLVTEFFQHDGLDTISNQGKGRQQ